MQEIMPTEIGVTSPEPLDSEAESMIVHANGDTNVEDLLSESELETDIDIDVIESSKINSDSSSLKLEPRAKTRLLSRSHSVNDLNDQIENCSEGINAEPPRRNSSGDYPSPTHDESTPSPKPSPNILLQELDLTRYKGTQQHRSSLTPTSSLLQLSPVTIQYSSISWRSPQPQDKEDNFSMILQTTAERVLTRLKTRQQDLGGNVARGQKSQRKHSITLQQPSVPRKLQPIMRDGSKTPRSDSELKNLNSDSDFGPLSAA